MADICEMNREELMEAAEQRLLRMASITGEMADVLIDNDSPVSMLEQCIWVMEETEKNLREHAQTMIQDYWPDGAPVDD